jgi:hypothetical protein
MQTFFRHAHAALTFSLIASSVSTGCGTASKANAPVPEQAAALQKPSPVKVAFLQDKTGSANWTRTPQPTLDELQMLVDLLCHAGGELGVGLIRDDSNRGLLRLRIEPPPEDVPKPTKTGRPFADARRMEQYRNDKAVFQQRLAAWHAETEGRIARFRKDAQPLLDQRSDARSTDVWGAVRRADVFLNEDDTAWHRPTHRWAVFATDGLHNRRAVKAAVMKNGARIMVINSDAQFGSLALLHPEPFESIEAAFRHLRAAEGRK